MDQSQFVSHEDQRSAFSKFVSLFNSTTVATICSTTGSLQNKILRLGNLNSVSRSFRRFFIFNIAASLLLRLIGRSRDQRSFWAEIKDQLTQQLCCCSSSFPLPSPSSQVPFLPRSFARRRISQYQRAQRPKTRSAVGGDQ